MSFALELDNEVSYDYLQKRIAIESIASPSMFSLFSQIIPKTSELLRSFVPQFSQFTGLSVPSNSATVIKLDNKQRQAVLKAMTRFSFTAYEETLISVPEGFNGKLIPYLEVLIGQGKVLIEHGFNVIKGYNTELAMFLSNYDIRTTLKSHSQHYAKIRQEREQYQKAVEAFFNSKQTSLSRQPLGKVMDRFGDLEKVFILEETLLNLKKRQDFKTIVSEVQKTADMLTLIKGRIDDGTITDASGQAIKNLTEGSYEAAKYVEYIALYAYFVETVLGSINNTSSQLGEIFGVN